MPPNIAVTADTFFNGPLTKRRGVLLPRPRNQQHARHTGSFTSTTSTLTAAPVNTGTINCRSHTLTIAPAWSTTAR